jgi:hypothetical protein
MPIFVQKKSGPPPFFPNVNLSLSRIHQQLVPLKENGARDRLVYEHGKFDKGLNTFWIDDRGIALYPKKTLYMRAGKTKEDFTSKIELWSTYDPRRRWAEDREETVVIKYIKPDDKEIQFIGFLNSTPDTDKLTNLPQARIMGAVQEKGRIRIPIVYHAFNGDLQDFILQSKSSFYNLLDIRNILVLGKILTQTYLGLRRLGFYYTDSKPANVLYHFIRPRNDRGGGYPFNVVLGDLGSMVNRREVQMLREKNSKYRSFAPQTFPYPIRTFESKGEEDGEIEENVNYAFYDRKKYTETHENRLAQLEKVVIWGLGMILLQMSLHKPTHQRAFQETFAHAVLTEKKYLDFIKFLLNNHDREITVDTLLRRPRVQIARNSHEQADRAYLNDIPQIILDILMLRAPDTLEGVIRALEIELRKLSSKKKRSRSRDDRGGGVKRTKTMIKEVEKGRRNLALRRKYNRRRLK